MSTCEARARAPSRGMPPCCACSASASAVAADRPTRDRSDTRPARAAATTIAGHGRPGGSGSGQKFALCWWSSPQGSETD